MENNPRSCDFILSRRVLFKLFICFAMSCPNLVTSFSRQKTLKSKKQKHTIFFVKVLPFCKVWVQTNRKCKNSSYALLCVLYAHPTLTVSWSRILCKLHQSRAVIPKLNRVFSLLGIPMVLGSDSGPPLDEQTFLNFSKFLGFKQMRKTAKNPLANTEAEEFSRQLRSSTTYAK